MKVLIPLPRRDFDPSEVAISWRVLIDAGHTITFATPDASVARGDPVMVSGCGLDYWGRVPGLRHVKLVSLLLRANRRARQAYCALVENAAFSHPIAYEQIRSEDFDGVLLPGGHAQGIREYLESAILQRAVAEFFRARKPVAAICHGVVLAARSMAAVGGKSVLFGRKTTALTWKLEHAAWLMSRYGGRWWDRHYYRTYREQPGDAPGYRGVQAEVTRALACPADFLDVPADVPHRWRKVSGLHRDTPHDARAAFVVRDGNYVSARWPGDAHTFAATFVQILSERPAHGA